MGPEVIDRICVIKNRIPIYFRCTHRKGWSTGSVVRCKLRRRTPLPVFCGTTVSWPHPRPPQAPPHRRKETSRVLPHTECIQRRDRRRTCAGAAAIRGRPCRRRGVPGPFLRPSYELFTRLSLKRSYSNAVPRLSLRWPRRSARSWAGCNAPQPLPGRFHAVPIGPGQFPRPS